MRGDSATLATRALRRPVADDASHRHAARRSSSTGRELRGFETGIQYALARVLVDPQFIYRFERVPAGVRAGDGLPRQRPRAGVAAVVLPLEQHPGRRAARGGRGRRASRAGACWSSRRGACWPTRSRRAGRQPRGPVAQLRQLEDVAPGTKEFDGNLRYSFRRETELLFETIVREDRSILDLHRRRLHVRRRAARAALRHAQHPRQPVPPCRLADERAPRAARPRQPAHGHLGGEPHVAGEARQVDPREPARRAGAAAATRRRDESGRDRRGAARRQRRCGSGSNAIAPNPSCASCHAVMDPIGFCARELRPDRGVAHDRRRRAGGRAAAGLPTARSSTVPTACARRCSIVARPLAATAAEKLLTYALGRRLEYFDMPAVRRIVRERGAAEDYRFSSLVAGIVRACRSR